MPKNILIFSDGTGQVGGLRPDQRLSNVYKMYRAMRPGPFSPIDPKEQVCFYDAGLGAGEVDVTEEMQLSIAAQACLFIVNRDTWYDRLFARTRFV